MKTIFTTILLAFVSFAFSQNEKEVYFDWKTNELKIEKGDTSSLSLPFALRFKEASFKTKQIKWKDGLTVIPGSTKKFSSIKLAESDNGYYKINMEMNEDKVVSSILGETVLPKNSVTIEISGKSITLRYNDKKDKNEITDKTKKNGGKYTPGYLYYDAIALVSDSLSPKDKLEVLESYGYKGSADNLYLKDFFNDINAKAGAHVSLSPSTLLTNIGGTDVTYLAAGLARFLAERAKDELNEAFFTKMKEQLNAYPELKTVFPKTAAFLDVIETYSYASILQVLKEAFETDVQNLPENLYYIKDLTRIDCNKSVICNSNEECKAFKKCQERLDKLSAFFDSQNGHWVALGLLTVKEGIQSTNPAEFLKTVTLSDELEALKKSSLNSANKSYNDYNIVSTIELTNLISQSLVSKDSKQVWITSSELNTLFTKKDAFKVYLGLLLSFEQRTDNLQKIITFYQDNSGKNTITFGEILKNIYGTTDQYQSDAKKIIRNSYTAYSAANNAVKKIIAASDKSISAEPQALYDYYRSFTSSLKSIVSSSLLQEKVNKDFSKDFNKVEQFLNPAVDMAYHTAVQKYSAAVYDATILLNNLNTDSEDLKKMTKSFVKYGTLVSTVAGAQSSDEVKKALDASVLPVGSASIKRKTDWSFSINAYVGAFWSYKNTAVSKDSIPSLGLAAPIGFNASKGTRNGKWGGFSANIQVIDLGALVNYYLIKGDAAALPNDFNVKLSNIFAPGFNLLYNIPKTPLSLGWGGQYIPTLYKYEQINGANNLVATNAWRWQVSLLVDIPLFNLKVWDF